MFEDQNQNPSAPKNLPTEPVDMFAGVDKGESEKTPAPAIPDALSAGLLKKKPEVSAMPSGAETSGQTMSLENYQTKGPILGKILILLFVVLVVGALGFVGWWFLYGKNNYVKPTTSAPKTETAPVTPASPNGSQGGSVSSNGGSVNTGTGSDIPAKINNDQILFGEAVDTDKDGLDDVREKEIGSDRLSADTDKDGLSDGDEVIIWKTNPLNSDSDGDSYPDGTEVKNGYNPLGPGKLFNLPPNATSSAAGS